MTTSKRTVVSTVTSLSRPGGGIGSSRRSCAGPSILVPPKHWNSSSGFPKLLELRHDVFGEALQRAADAARVERERRDHDPGHAEFGHLLDAGRVHGATRRHFDRFRVATGLPGRAAHDAENAGERRLVAAPREVAVTEPPGA